MIKASYFVTALPNDKSAGQLQPLVAPAAGGISRGNSVAANSHAASETCETQQVQDLQHGMVPMELNLPAGFPKPVALQEVPKGHSNYTWEDIKCMLVLLALYTVQGIPLGLRTALPLIIYDRVSYSQMAYLSCTALPFCLKLLWAPVVDVLYCRRLGKRKTWIIPIQIICALLLLYGGFNNKMDRWVGQYGEPVDIFALTVYFTVLYMLMATQDIVVDAWALTMLRPEMRMHTSTCNTAGQAIGINIAYMGFTTLNSREMRVYVDRVWGWIGWFFGVRSTDLIYEDEMELQPFVSLSGVTWFFGLITIIITVVVFFKKEEEDMPMLLDLPEVTELSSRDETPYNRKIRIIKHSYARLKQIMMLKPAKMLAIALLTCNFFFVVENPAELQILEKGIHRDVFAAVTLLFVPIQIIFPPFVSHGKLTTISFKVTMGMHHSSASDILCKGLKIRLITVVLYTGLVTVTGSFYAKESHSAFTSALFYTCFFSISVFRKVCELVVVVSFNGLFARVADPSVGGTYMTLLNTLSNVGEILPKMIGLWMIDVFSKAYGDGTDGLYLETLLCALGGVAFLPKFRSILTRIESFELSEWYLNKFADE